MKKRIFVFGALGLSIFCGAGTMLFGQSLCTNTLMAEALSPGARYVARYYMQSCYMDSITGLSVIIAAEPERRFLWWHPDQVTALAIGAYAHRAGLSIQWLDAQSLQIDYTRSDLFNGCSGGMRSRIEQWRDLRIQYRGLCEDYD